jgi:iron complex outermembrane receptor protein
MILRIATFFAAQTHGVARAVALASLGVFALPACADDVAPAEPTNAAPPAPAKSTEPTKPAEPAKLDRVEVIGTRASDTEERRQSTAAKIVVGRDEIERLGDGTVGELLKRLPGVTVQGAPGRGGAIRMRGLGSGYTQILLDGERVPPGFSIDSLTPEQIERIEILRAPTAETGARAIAGTINIITREGYRKRINDLKLGVGVQNDEVSPGLSWTRNDSVGAMVYNLSLSAYNQRRANDSDIVTTNQTLDTGVTTLARDEQITGQEQRYGLNFSSRLQWRGEAGESLLLSPFVIFSNGKTQSQAALTQSVGLLPAPYASARADGESNFALLRLNGQWNRRLNETMRIEMRGGLGGAQNDGSSVRNEFDEQGSPLQTIDDQTQVRDRSFNLSGKLIALQGGEHSIVSGAELEGTRRVESETYTSTQSVDSLLTEFRDYLQGGTMRVALYAQDEWNPSEQWSAQAGLRWEGIVTEGDQTNGSTVRNRSSVWAPIAHAVWKPEEASRDQIRVSLTRSYRTPTLQNLIGQPSISRLYPVPGTNIPTSPDRVGNPELRPELAGGIDIAFEHYLPAGGLLSANLFRRNISNLIRSVTTLQDVPWSTVPRWVAQPQNIGNAVTQGLELEAKFRLTDVLPDAPALDVRANASLFHSRVASVPGPNNSLDQQPPATANLGVDYRLRSVPLTLGANVNWNPAYTTRLSDVQIATQGRKIVIDANALWVFTPGVQLRLTASNLDPADYLTGGSFDTALERETTQTTARTYVNWQLRLEMKL